MSTKKFLFASLFLAFSAIPLYSQETLPHNIFDNGEYALGYFFIPGNSEQFWPDFSNWDVPVSVPIHGISIRYFLFLDSLDKKTKFYIGSGGMRFFYGSGDKQINNLYGYEAFSHSTIIGGTAALASIGIRHKLGKGFVFDGGINVLRFGACYNKLRITIIRDSRDVELYSCENRFVHCFSKGDAFASLGWKFNPWRTLSLKVEYDMTKARGPEGNRGDPVHSASASFGGIGIGVEETFNQYVRPNPLYIYSAIAVLTSGVVAFFR